MAEVIPFRGILYNRDAISADDVTAPPYDIITPSLRKKLYKKNPYNIVRIDAGMKIKGDSKTDNKYMRAKVYLKEWLKKGILIKSKKPCFYAYEMLYQSGRELKSLKGFFGLVRLKELGDGIYPHECTYSKPMHDRITLLKVCGANTSPIFSLYRSPERKTSTVLERVRLKPAYMEAHDLNGNLHRLWFISDADSINSIKADLSDKAIFIADGHHRYETALEYKKAQKDTKGNEPFNYVLMFLTNIADEELTILPTHRLIKTELNVLKTLSGYFSINELSYQSDIIDAIAGHKHTIGLALKKARYILRYKGNNLKEIHPALRRLDVVMLDEMVLRRLLNVSDISYEMDAEKAQLAVKSGRYSSAFFLNPTTVKDVEDVAISSVRMPPKSTYFYPKLLTGFIINSLSQGIGTF